MTCRCNNTEAAEQMATVSNLHVVAGAQVYAVHLKTDNRTADNAADCVSF